MKRNNPTFYAFSVSYFGAWIVLMFSTSRHGVDAMPATSVYVTDDVSNDDVVAAKVESFKRDILDRLGYDHKPDVRNVTTSIEEKRRMILMYKTYIAERDAVVRKDNRASMYAADDDGGDDSKAQSMTFYSIDYTGVIAGSVHTRDWEITDAYRIYFTPQLAHPRDAGRQRHINSAKFRVFVNHVHPDNLKDKFTVDKQIRVNVFQILSINSARNYKRKLLDSKLVSLERTGWESFEIGGAVQSWIDDDTTNLGLEIATESQNIHDVLDLDFTINVQNRYDIRANASSSVRRNTSSTSSSINGDTSSTALAVESFPSLDTDTSPSIHVYAQERSILKRVKRRGKKRGDCKRGDGETKCCRYPIKISFKDIGWDDWVIAPHEYRGYYCAGSCPYRHKMANTFAGIKALLHLKSPDKVPSPCCVATKLSPFTILHYDYDGKYTFSDYPDLVVEQCRCG